MPEYLHRHPEFADLISIVGEDMGIIPALVEKDYWSIRAGRKNVDDDEIRRRIAAGASKASVACDLNVSRMTVYPALVSVDEQSTA